MCKTGGPRCHTHSHSLRVKTQQEYARAIEDMKTSAMVASITEGEESSRAFDEAKAHLFAVSQNYMRYRKATQEENATPQAFREMLDKAGSTTADSGAIMESIRQRRADNINGMVHRGEALMTSDNVAVFSREGVTTTHRFGEDGNLVSTATSIDPETGKKVNMVVDGDNRVFVNGREFTAGYENVDGESVMTLYPNGSSNLSDESREVVLQMAGAINKDTRMADRVSVGTVTERRNVGDGHVPSMPPMVTVPPYTSPYENDIRSASIDPLTSGDAVGVWGDAMRHQGDEYGMRARSLGMLKLHHGVTGWRSKEGNDVLSVTHKDKGTTTMVRDPQTRDCTYRSTTPGGSICEMNTQDMRLQLITPQGTRDINYNIRINAEGRAEPYVSGSFTDDEKLALTRMYRLMPFGHALTFDK